MIRRPPRSTRTDTLFPPRRPPELAVRPRHRLGNAPARRPAAVGGMVHIRALAVDHRVDQPVDVYHASLLEIERRAARAVSRKGLVCDGVGCAPDICPRSEEHTSELQSLMRTSYAVFCLKKTTYENTVYSHC